MTDRTHYLDMDIANEDCYLQWEMEQVLTRQYKDLSFVVLTLNGPAGGNPLVRVFGTEETIRTMLLSIYADWDGHVDHMMKRLEIVVRDH